MDTIYALSTGSILKGNAAICVVRISGSKTKDILNILCPKKQIEPRKAQLFKIVTANKEVIDKAIVIFFASPNSYSGEDMLELHLHASQSILNKLFHELSIIDDVRPAKRGEFTLRGFYNNKFDLTQADAVMDLIDAKTEHQRKNALTQMDGKLSQLYQSYRDKLVDIVALLTSMLDFPQDELPPNLLKETMENIKNLRNKIDTHIKDDRGKKLINGLKVAIFGPTNVGKSSLLNYLARRDIAIVSDGAGTTRDILEIMLDIAGYPIIFYDTAGIRKLPKSNKTSLFVELEGIKRAKDLVAKADFKLLVVDDVAQIAKFSKYLTDDNTLILLNKIDQQQATQQDSYFSSSHKYNNDILAIAVKNGRNMDFMLKYLAFKVKNIMSTQDAISTHSYYLNPLKKVVISLNKSLSLSLEPELMAEELNLAISQLASLVGDVDIEGVLDKVFSRFCIGK